jgi:pimeloyl-ACP methyl ester carboxylesterase
MSYQFADINGIKIHYAVQGEGPALVLIHAGIAHLGMWEAQIPACTPHFQVIRHDVRGFGLTPDPAGKYTDHDDLKALLDHLGVKRAHLLGISNGGRIAIDFAVSYPDMVEKLVLVAPGLGGYKGEEDTFEKHMYEEYDKALEAGDKALAAEYEARVWVDGPRRKPEDVDPVFRKRALELIRYTVDLGIGDGEGDIARPPAAERMADIQAPTLLILGEEDVDFLVGVAEALEVGIPNLKRVSMPGTAHLPPMEKADEFNRIVLDFLLER